MQVNENVNASNFLAVGNLAAKGSRAKAAKSEQTDFASFLTPSADTSVKTQSDMDSQTDAKNVSSEESVSRESAPDKNVADTKKENVQKTDPEAEREPLCDEAVSAKHADAVEETEQVDENGQDFSVEETDAFLGVVGHILQQVMELSGLNAMELKGKLDEMGIEPEDLFSEKGLKEIFLSVKSAEVSDLIVKEDLNQEWNQFLNAVHEEMEQAEISWHELNVYAGKQNTEIVFEKVFQNPSNLVENFSQKNTVNQPVGMEMQADLDEPSVVLFDEKPMEDHQNAMDFQMEKKQESYDLGEAEDITKPDFSVDKADKKDTHFEHPVLQAVEQTLDNIRDISFAKDIPVSGREIIDQIVEMVKVKMNQDTTSLEMQLYPEHLGKIQIHVVSKDGVMTARIVAETEAAKQAVEGGLTSLKESLEQQNLKVDAIEVMVSTTGFESGEKEQNSYAQQKKSRSGRKLDLSELQEDEAVKEAAELEKMKYTGSSVSYTA